MSVIFKAVIKANEESSWYIELTDTVDGRVHDCQDIEEFSKKVEEFGQDYGGNIDEVNWSKDDNVSPYAMEEIKILMAQEQEKMDKLKEEAGES